MNSVAGMLGPAMPGGSSVMSGLDALMGMGGGAPAMGMLGGAPPGAAAATDRIFAAQSGGGGRGGSDGDKPSLEDELIRQGVGLIPGVGPFVAPFMKGGALEDVPKHIPNPLDPLKTPNPFLPRVPPQITPEPQLKPAPEPKPAPKPDPTPEPPAPAPRKPMSGPMPEMPWFLEPAGPSTW